MATQLMGPISWRLARDDEGHREYEVIFLVRSAITDGPASVLITNGLPRPGDFYNIGGDFDLWAFCKRRAEVVPHDVKQGEKARQWTVKLAFSTKPDKECKSDSVENPLLQPLRISGTFVRYMEEATQDRFGRYIRNSSHEQIRGPIVEFDNNKAQVRIVQNVINLELDLFSPMIDTVNELPMWGLPPRCIKLSNVPWEKNTYGTCNYYYTRTLEFDIDTRTFDRVGIDEGTKVLHGEWNVETGDYEVKQFGNGDTPDKNNPNHFIRFYDRHANASKTLLDGNGLPFSPENVTAITECTLCPGSGGTVSKIRVQNLFEGTLILTHLSGCLWSGTSSNGHDYTLSGADAEVTYFNRSGSLWTLEDTTTGDVWYNNVNGGTLWNCTGSNLMVPDTFNTFEPVTLVMADRPGSVEIQKYPESNFLLLGVPVLL